MDILTAVVPEHLSGRRLDQVLASLYPQHSRSRLQAWISAGQVTVNDRILRQKDAVRCGERIVIIPVFQARDDNHAEAIPLQVLYEDAALLVIDKPAGLVVHPGAGNPRHTLLNALLYYDPGLARVPRSGIVQRLDKDTSGIMVIARTPEVHTYLVGQLRQRRITRDYEAVVTGVLTAGGTIEAPIGRHPTLRTRMAVSDHGKPAITHYRVLKKYPRHTHISVRLETGRTHQIRVHLSHIRFPIVGDPVYGVRKRVPANIPEDLRNTLLAFPRQALHASRLTLVHPVSLKELSWMAPLPEDIRSLLAALGTT